MTDRERLIHLITSADISLFGTDKPYAEVYADHLLANGVIVPPCKVGDTVWFDTYKKNATVNVGIQPHTVDRIDINYICDTKNVIETSLPSWIFGKTVFLTKEEAEKALAERSEGK